MSSTALLALGRSTDRAEWCGVEALVILNRVAEAEAALDAYLGHPDLDAFEVSSTYRQFREVLQLKPETPVMQRLSEAVERFRGGGAFA